MIAMTLGTISYPFDRAVKWLKICLDEDIISEPVFVQHGSTNVSSIINHPLVTTKTTIPLESWLDMTKQARFVISHAGQGSTRTLVEQGVPFFLLPRLARYGEHVDNHQMMFVRSIEHTGVKYCLTLEEFRQAVKDPPASLKTDIFNKPKLATYLLSKYPKA